MSSSIGETEHSHVGFNVSEEKQRKHKRYLTAKYDRKTRKIYSEKTRIDEFILAELRKLYKNENDDYDCAIDSEMISNSLDSDRRDILEEKLQNCPATDLDKQNFISSLLEKVTDLDELMNANTIQKPGSSLR